METGPRAFCFNSLLVGGVPDTPQSDKTLPTEKHEAEWRWEITVL